MRVPLREPARAMRPGRVTVTFIRRPRSSMSSPASPGPLRFERRFFDKPWGGRSLARRPGIALPASERIGETWELVDRAEECSVVAVGPERGRSLRELMREHGRAILGRVAPARDGRFPLLVKYIDAREALSIQVHPDDEGAARLGAGAEGKTEAWYIVDVSDGGTLYAGLRPGVEAEAYRRVAAGPAGVEALVKHAVVPGDCLLVPGGTVHAIGAGVTLLEVQQNSDTTYRIWDWGRVGLDGRPRETHLERALASIRFGRPAPRPLAPAWAAVAGQAGLERAPLARSAYFAMDALRLAGRAELPCGEQFQIVAVLGGRGTLSVLATRPGAARDGGEQPFAPGDVWLVPAACGAFALEGELELVQLFHHD